MADLGSGTESGETSLGPRLHFSQGESPTAKVALHNLSLPPVGPGLAPFTTPPSLAVLR